MKATRLITSSEDDDSPVIMLWDLRNTRAPERVSIARANGEGYQLRSQILSGHQKGVLSVAWCRQDADLLLSCGKDNRTLCWNPQTGEIVGEVRFLQELIPALTRSCLPAMTGPSKQLGVPGILISSPQRLSMVRSAFTHCRRRKCLSSQRSNLLRAPLPTTSSAR